LIAGRLLIDVSGRYIEIGENKIAAEVIQEAEAIGRRTGDLDYIAQLACIRTQDLAIARDLPAARIQLAKGLSYMHRQREVRPELTAECATAGAFVAQSDGDFATAIVLLSNAVATLERAGLTDEARYINTRNDLARAFLFAGDFHRAWDVENRTMELARDSGRGESVAYLSVSCSALRNGGQPRRALELVDSIVVAARRANSEFNLPYYLYGCRALSEIALGRPQDANVSLLRAAEAAEKAGGQSATYRIGAVTMGIEQGDLQAADDAWGLLASEEDRVRGANDRGEGAVRLILTHARLDLAHARVAEALRRVEVAAALVAARHQQSNPDGREVELVWAQACMESGAYVQAQAHAGKAVALARAAAVDPDSSAWIGEALIWRARSEAALGKAAAAVRTAREALPHLEANLDPAHPLIAAATHIVGAARSGT
jgi:tetratricopeptide (TPR) repeat protein